jgi:UDP:flavonoid glycosyltransferase YjiC (YdhE family)
MRILVATTAGAGHFAPLVPFARACAEAGHEVRVAAPASFADTVGRAGLLHLPLSDAAPEALGAAFARIPELTMRRANDFVIRDVFGGLDAEAALPGLRAAVEEWRPDVLLRESAEVASYVVAVESGLPYVEVNIGLDAFADELAELLEEPIRGLGCAAGTAAMREAPRWTLLPASFDLEATGTLGAPTRFREPILEAGRVEDLPGWWADRDDPLVYVTFGSVAAGLGLFPRFYGAVLESLADAPVRVLMTLGEAGAPEELGTLPANIHVERWWPQAQVMPHAAAIVGHGGFGTTMTALVAGVPQVVVPLFSSDQFANAERVDAVRAGVALAEDGVADRLAGSMLPAGPSVLDRLADAVLRAVHDDVLSAGARDVAAEITGLPEVAACVPLLEDLVRTGR